jgi:hypothetical protein
MARVCGRDDDALAGVPALIAALNACPVSCSGGGSSSGSSGSSGGTCERLLARALDLARGGGRRAAAAALLCEVLSRAPCDFVAARGVAVAEAVAGLLAPANAADVRGACACGGAPAMVI